MACVPEHTPQRELNAAGPDAIHSIGRPQS